MEEKNHMSKASAKIRNWLGIELVDEDEAPRKESEDREQELDAMETKEPRRREKKVSQKVVDFPSPQSQLKVIIYRPVSYNDTMSIIGNLKSKKPVILDMAKVDYDIAQRILDFLSGACSAMGGDLQKVSSKIFVVVPAGCEIVGNSDGYRE